MDILASPRSRVVRTWPFLFLFFALSLSACGGGGSSGAIAFSSSTGNVERYALVTSLNGDTITSYAVEPGSGAMRVVDRMGSVTEAMAVEVDPSRGQVLVAVAGGFLFQYELNERGRLSYKYGLPTEGNDLRDLVRHPSGNYLYLADITDGTINQWTYDEFDQIAEMDAGASAAPDYLGAGFSALVVQPDGSHVYAADFSQDRIARFLVGPDGSLSYVDYIAAGNGPFKLELHPDGNWLYALNRLDGTVSMYAIQGDGALVSLGAAQAMGDASISLEGIAMDADGDYLYVSDNDNDKIWQFSTGVDGLLTPLATDSVSIDSDVSLRNLVASPDASRIYLLDGSSQDNTGSRMLAFSIGEGGELAPAEPEQIATDEWPSDMAFTTGKPLQVHSELAYVVNGSSQDINQFTLDDDGTLTEFALGDEPATGAFPVAAAAHPTGKYIYVANYTDDTVSQFRRSTSLANRDELNTINPAEATDAGPVDVVAHPTGNFLYVLCRDNNSISRFDVATNGALSNRTDHSVGFTPAVAMAMDPMGRFLWVVNDKDAGAARVILYTVNPKDGTLDYQLARLTGDNPKALAVSQDGKRLYVATEENSELWVHSVAADGTPDSASQVATDSGPVRVAVSPDDNNVYAVNTVSSNVSQYVLSGPTTLSALDPDAESTGTAPLDIAVDVTGRNVLVTNTAAGTITRLRADPSGLLQEQEDVAVGTNPQAVVTIGYTE